MSLLMIRKGSWLIVNLHTINPPSGIRRLFLLQLQHKSEVVAVQLMLTRTVIAQINIRTSSY